MMPHAGSEEEAMNLFFEGETNRAIAEHQVSLHGYLTNKKTQPPRTLP